jgi:hypothetical protein
MGFDISNLGSYVQNNGSTYAMKAVASAKTAKALIDARQVQFGVKGTAAILKLDSEVTLADGSSCSRTGGSNINLSNKNIVAKQIKDEANLCPSTLWNTFYADSIAQGQTPQEELLPVFAQAIMDDRAKKIAAVNEKLLWQGDTSLTGSTNMKRIDGILKLAAADSASAITATGSTTVEKLQNVYLSSSVDVRNSEDYHIFVGEDTYAQYTIALAAKNIFKPIEDMTVFGTPAKMFVTSGLNGTGKVFASRLGNLQLAMDGMGEYDSATMKFSVETNNWYQDFKYALGVAVVWGSETVIASGF